MLCVCGDGGGKYNPLFEIINKPRTYYVCA